MQPINITGDLLDAPNGINVIVHQANTDGIMGAGIAKAIKDKWPEVYDADKNYHVPFGSERLGWFSFANVKCNGERVGIVNLYGQRLKELSRFGIPTDYDALLQSMMRLKDSLLMGYNLTGDLAIIGFPKGMGCGLGGGDWDGEVLPRIKAVFDKTLFPVYIVEKKMK